jgi:signal transduction histidine kinase
MSLSTPSSAWGPARRERVIPAIAGALLVGAAALAEARGTHGAAAVCGGIGALIALAMLAPRVAVQLRRRPALWVIVVLVGLIVWWVVAGLSRVAHPSVFDVPAGSLLSNEDFPGRPFFDTNGWPWRLGRIPLIIPILTLAAAGGGLVLVADAVRLALGLGRRGRTPWRLLNSATSPAAQSWSRALPGVALILAAAGLAVAYTGSYVGFDTAWRLIFVLLVGLWAAALIVGPPVIGLWLLFDRDTAGRAREEERLRFAAHLHDSVLQTLALIQRQSHDPTAVARLARRQEHALRAWMAGHADLAALTLASALRDVVAEVEDERAISVELSLLGDRRLDPGGEALVGAVREALRNAAAHADGSPVTLFAQIEAGRAEIFVRDDGPGFDIATVPHERRGIRDAIIGRMAGAGGSAIVESEPGEGTEVILRLG